MTTITTDRLADILDRVDEEKKTFMITDLKLIAVARLFDVFCCGRNAILNGPIYRLAGKFDDDPPFKVIFRREALLGRSGSVVIMQAARREPSPSPMRTGI